MSKLRTETDKFDCHTNGNDILQAELINRSELMVRIDIDNSEYDSYMYFRGKKAGQQFIGQLQELVNQMPD